MNHRLMNASVLQLIYSMDSFLKDIYFRIEIIIVSHICVGICRI
jgi:hypothetical protein